MGDDYTDYLEEFDEYGIFALFGSGEKLFTRFIDPNMYKRALSEFTKYGQLMRFPERYVWQWWGIILENTAKLRSCTAIAAHTEYIPFEPFFDYFFGSEDEEAWNEWKQENSRHPDSDLDSMIQYLDDIKFFDNGNGGFCVLPDGSDAWSDYGLEPLEQIISEYHDGMSAEEVLVLINKAIDVSHCRGDISSMFIQGGSKVLWSISNESRNRKRRTLAERRLVDAVVEDVFRKIRLLG